MPRHAFVALLVCRLREDEVGTGTERADRPVRPGVGRVDESLLVRAHLYRVRRRWMVGAGEAQCEIGQLHAVAVADDLPVESVTPLVHERAEPRLQAFR